MASFLSESYLKPKLTEPKLVKKIIETQNNEFSFETKVKNFFIEFIKNNYLIILAFLIIFGLLYWRYNETQQKRKSSQSVEIYEEDSDNITSEEYY
jgi:predicted negative regulator of RcsB-dependent stress response